MQQKILRFSIIILLIFTGNTIAQTTHILHYTTVDGLPSNKVYCANQDASGFLWLGTDNGLVRYNGTEFKTFTVRDGLPDNDIYTVFEDAGNRLWVLGFKQAPCYFFKNKLYTTRNDSLLARYFKDPDMFKFVVNRNLKRILFFIIYNNQCCVFEYGTIRSLQTPTYHTDVRKFLKGPNLNLFNSNGIDYLLSPNEFFGPDGKNNSNVRPGIISIEQIKYRGESIAFGRLLNREQISVFKITGDSLKAIKTFNINGNIGPFANTGNEAVVITEAGDIYTYDSSRFDFEKKTTSLPGGRYSTSFIDKAGNIWICTHDNGIFVYPKHSSEIISYKKGATSIITLPGKEAYCVGFEDKSLLLFNGRQSSRSINIPDRDQIQSRITGLAYTKGHIYIAGDFKLARVNVKSGKYETCNDLHSGITTTLKDMELCTDGRLLLGSANGAAYYNTDSLRINEHLWSTRTTAVWQIPCKGTYLGTINGLHFKPEGTDKISQLITNSPLDKARITDIKSDAKGRLWVGTAQFGLFIIDGSRLKQIDDISTSGCSISSYYIKCIFIDNNGIGWLGTDKGVNRIKISPNGECKTERITTSFGIPNDNINSLSISNDTVYLSSLDGVFRFTYNAETLSETPGFEITGITVNGEKREDGTQNIFKYFENNIIIEYAAIAFRSARNIVYEYRLAEESTEWVKTHSSRLDLLNLKSGDYKIEIRAVNIITGEKSASRFVVFTILRPWYKSWWFNLLLIIVTILITILMVRNHINTIKQQSDENNRINKQFAELEMQALRAQMNPHFIFNALSAIQNYFVTNKEEKANAFMARFARLIRQMLDYSKDNFIPLDEEISLISNYLSLEKMRFEGHMDFSIDTDPSIDPTEYVLPSLLLQPLLENAVNHGIMPSKTPGHIKLDIHRETLFLACEITDNGIGINQSKGNKDKPKGHQSMGMNILLKRIDSINQLYNSNVKIDIRDRSVFDPTTTGTTIVLKFPLQLVTKTIQHKP